MRLRGLLLGLTLLCAVTGHAATSPPPVFSTWGVHNTSHTEDCAVPGCLYRRRAGEPSDPKYPVYWTSHWVMYRIFRNYEHHLPPYDGRPPRPLKEGLDYQTSWGVTYFDSTWSGPGGKGAMEEDYANYCLPIFPFANHYSCSFISLGRWAYFVTYDDRPKWMPPVCVFSLDNAPPARDFVKHLPYSKQDDMA